MTLPDFQVTVEQHRADLVRFAARLYEGLPPAQDVVQETVARLLAKGYEACPSEPDAARRWLRSAVRLTGLAMRRAAGRQRHRDGLAGGLQARDGDLTVTLQGGDEETGEGAVSELGGARRDGWAVVDDLIQDEGVRELYLALDDLPGKMGRALLLVYGHGATWAEAAAEIGHGGSVEAFRKSGQRAMARLRRTITR